jgi:hypothetical protein
MHSKPFRHVGQLIIYPTGTNPYHRDTENPYRIGELRQRALENWKYNCTLPHGYSVWDDKLKEDVLSSTEVIW